MSLRYVFTYFEVLSAFRRIIFSYYLHLPSKYLIHISCLWLQDIKAKMVVVMLGRTMMLLVVVLVAVVVVRCILRFDDLFRLSLLLKNSMIENANENFKLL